LSNSRFIKDKKYDKVLLSKKFFEKVEENQTEIKLSQDTINAFKQVFNKISNGFK
jgi:fatty acid-binding protein DegV